MEDMMMDRLLKLLFPGVMRAEYNRGYREAVDQILLLPEKVRLGNTLPVGPNAVITNCSFIGGDPAIRASGNPAIISR